jgi:hypothetical protein
VRVGEVGERGKEIALRILTELEKRELEEAAAI